MNRVGKKVNMKSLHLTGAIGLIAGRAGTGVSDYLRVMVVYDRQPGAAAPAITDILRTFDQTGAQTTTALSGLNPVNSDRFVMLRDLRIDIPNDLVAAAVSASGAIIDYSTNRVNINEFIKLGDMEAAYKSTANPILEANFSTGVLYLVTYGLNPTASNVYSVAFTTRLRYTDP